jgi:hypothetical protein
MCSRRKLYKYFRTILLRTITRRGRGRHVAGMWEATNAGNFVKKTWKKDHSGDLGVECTILKCTSELMWDGISWIHGVWDRDKKRIFVRTVWNFRVTCNAKNIVTEWGSISFLTLIHIADQPWITWTCAEQN